MMKNILIKSILLGSLAVGLNADFIRDNTKLVVNDTKTGLMWQDNAVGSPMNWNTAITTCENLTLGGYSDWRLPNIRELKSIVDRSRVNPSISPVFTQTTISNDYWSSSSRLVYTDFAWIVSFYSSDDDFFEKIYNRYVRCVRAGQ